MEIRPKRDYITFRNVWSTRVFLRQLGTTEAVVLQVSPKFATVYEHIAFQWSLKMFGTAYVVRLLALFKAKMLAASAQVY